MGTEYEANLRRSLRWALAHLDMLYAEDAENYATAVDLARKRCSECGYPSDHTLHGPSEKCEGCMAPRDHHDFVPETD